MEKNLLVEETGIIKKIRQIQEEYNALVDSISHPEDVRHPLYKERIKKIGEMEGIISLAGRYEGLVKKKQELTVLTGDEDLIELVKEEGRVIDKEIETVEKELSEFFFSAPDDKKNCLIEIRAGTGGTEAALFAKDLFRMYTKYAEKKGWNIEALNSHPSDLGGFKEIIFIVNGKNAYGDLKYESGVHRVQRVPLTESGGRIHTSAATVAVFPEIKEEEYVIDPKDLKIDTFCSSGSGGQSVNTTYSAVRITHIPTGIVASCQDERSQIQNRMRAMKILRAKINDLTRRKKEEEISRERKGQIKTGDRSEKIRTYNFPQNRITDHRINLTLYNLQEIIDGNLEPLTGNLKKETLRRSMP